MLPLISVITPTYNRKELLEKAILSVVNQKKDTPFEWEMIIVDDGSRDGTGEYIKKYLSEYPQIQYIYQENSGVGRARNVGIEHMSPQSDYLIFLDSDDELKNDVFLVTIDLLENERYAHFLGMYMFCEDQFGTIIGSSKFIHGIREDITYEDFLAWKIDFELLPIIRSSCFLSESFLRFPEDIVTEGVLWSKLWQYANDTWRWMRLTHLVGRLYRTSHTGEQKITQTISSDRFRKNAIGNERLIEIIWNDLLWWWFSDKYAELCVRAGINWVLAWERQSGLLWLQRGLSYKKSTRNLMLFSLSWVSPRWLLWLYKIYINH